MLELEELVKMLKPTILLSSQTWKSECNPRPICIPMKTLHTSKRRLKDSSMSMSEVAGWLEEGSLV